MLPLLPIISIIGSVIDKIIPDKAAAQKAKNDLERMAQDQEFQLILGQLKVNEAEAGSTNWFVAGWRPFVGWTCGAAFAYAFVLQPMLMYLAATFGTAETVKQVAMLPALDLGTMMPVLLGMLGLGGLRTIEKVKNSEGNR